jgi:hypothetical protein
MFAGRNSNLISVPGLRVRDYQAGFFTIRKPISRIMQRQTGTSNRDFVKLF